MRKRSINTIKLSLPERIGMLGVYAVMLFVILITLYPFIYIISMSISDPIYVLRQDIVLLPKGFSLGAYKMVFENNELWMHYANTIWYTVVGTFVNMVMTVMGAYPLSRKGMVGRKPCMFFISFTMFFSGGMIPFFIIVNKLGLYDTRWAMIIPVAVSAWNLIIARTFFQGISDSLIESAKLDGANDIVILCKIVLPLSKAILAVLALFYAVGHWNAYFNAVLFLPSVEKQPLQIYMQKILINMSEALVGGTQLGLERSMQVIQLRYAAIVVVILPIIFVYPFLQKYFVQGVMVGAIKE